MPQQTPAQARVIDPILSGVARGYRPNASPVADILFPIVSVGQRGGKVISFGPDDFKLYSTARAPGANTKRVQFGYSNTSYALVDYSLEGAVPKELMQEGQAVPNLNQGQIAIARVRNIQALEREKQCADLALNATTYAASNKVTLSGTDQWSDAAGGDPFGDVADGREAVRTQIGVRPNAMVLGPKVLTALRKNPVILNRLRGGKGAESDQSPATLQQLSDLFEMQVVEGGAIYHDGTSFVDVWGKFALLAYTLPASAAEMGSPNFGYTYQLDGYPEVEEPYYDRNTKTWYYPVTDARQPQFAGPSAGFLISAAVA